jgi:hypothetical protein
MEPLSLSLAVHRRTEPKSTEIKELCHGKKETRPREIRSHTINRDALLNDLKFDFVVMFTSMPLVLKNDLSHLGI